MKHIAPVSQAGAVGRMFGTTGKMQTDDPRKGGFEERGRGRRSRRSDSRISSGVLCRMLPGSQSCRRELPNGVRRSRKGDEGKTETDVLVVRRIVPGCRIRSSLFRLFFNGSRNVRAAFSGRMTVRVCLSAYLIELSVRNRLETVRSGNGMQQTGKAENRMRSSEKWRSDRVAPGGSNRPFVAVFRFAAFLWKGMDGLGMPAFGRRPFVF